MVENGKQQQRNTEADRKREFPRVTEKFRNMPKRDEAGTSSNNYQQSPEIDQVLEMQQRDEIETMSSESDQTIAVPALNFKTYGV